MYVPVIALIKVVLRLSRSQWDNAARFKVVTFPFQVKLGKYFSYLNFKRYSTLFGLLVVTVAPPKLILANLFYKAHIEPFCQRKIHTQYDR